MHEVFVTISELYRVPLALDVSATALGAIQGALFAGRLTGRRLDWLGVSLIGIVTGFGGGLVRGILLGEIPAPLRSDWYLASATVAAMLGMALQRVFHRLEPLIIGLDALAIGMFGAIGTTAALAHGLSVLAAIFVGVASAVGGSVLRDLLLALPIAIMHVGSLYAVAAGAGCALLVVLLACSTPVTIAGTVCVLVTAGVRLLAVRFGWSLPEQRAVGTVPVRQD